MKITSKVQIANAQNEDLKNVILVFFPCFITFDGTTKFDNSRKMGPKSKFQHQVDVIFKLTKLLWRSVNQIATSDIIANEM